MPTLCITSRIPTHNEKKFQRGTFLIVLLLNSYIREHLQLLSPAYKVAKKQVLLLLISSSLQLQGIVIYFLFETFLSSQISLTAASIFLPKRDGYARKRETLRKS